MKCPICDVERNHAALAHIWTHLRFEDPSPKHKNGARVCWCGRRYQAFVFWLEHMAGLDPQAHYAASLLGMKP
jgi:hypothetical protein